MLRTFTPEFAAKIFAEFDGCNHVELASRHLVSVQVIYRLLYEARLSAVAAALHLNGDTASEVLWAGPVTQLGFRGGLEAVLQALEKAEDMDALDRAVIAVAILPEGHPAAAGSRNPAPAPVVPIETRPGIPAHDDIAPAPFSDPASDAP